jgi:hypothetical protein
MKIETGIIGWDNAATPNPHPQSSPDCGEAGTEVTTFILKSGKLRN